MNMNMRGDSRQNYAIAFLLGAVGGGLLVTLATRAITKLMTQMMSGMMQTMMSRMRESGCNPSDI
jgi:hypothetical protein